MTPSPDQLLLHATAVAVDDQAVLIEGASGSGKSALALTLMAFGAVLVADDRVLLQIAGGNLIATPPATIAGRIEARGMGILKARQDEGVDSLRCRDGTALFCRVAQARCQRCCKQ